MTHQETFRLLLKQHYGEGGELVRLARSIVKDTDEAKDVVQTALMKAFLAYSDDVENFKAWMSTIVRRVAFTAYNKRSLHNTRHVQPTHPEGSFDSLLEKQAIPVAAPDSDVMINPVHLALEDAWKYKQLTKREYDVLRYDEEFNDRGELAKFLGISRNNCDQIHYRGLKKLILSMFTNSIHLLGGLSQIEWYFRHALANPPPEFTDAEAEVFESYVLRRKEIKTENWQSTLLSACNKMLTIQKIRDRFLWKKKQ